MWYNIYEVMKMENIKVNNIIEGQVMGVTKYGIFVSLCDNYTGMIHISEVSNKFVSNLEEKFKIGDVIKVKVLKKKVMVFSLYLKKCLSGLIKK